MSRHDELLDDVSAMTKALLDISHAALRGRRTDNDPEDDRLFLLELVGIHHTYLAHITATIEHKKPTDQRASAHAIN